MIRRNRLHSASLAACFATSSLHLRVILCISNCIARSSFADMKLKMKMEMKMKVNYRMGLFLCIVFNIYIQPHQTHARGGGGHYIT
jgi:hypothetical protein